MRKSEIIVLSVTVAIFAGVVSFLICKDIIIPAQSIELIILLILASATIIYAKRTSEIAKATKEQAKEMKEQRYDAVRPVIDIINMEQMPLELARQTYEKKQPNELRCKLCNVGVGPAIDVYSFVQPPAHERQGHDFHTIVVGKEKGPKNLALEQKDDRWFLVAYYKDVYGRCFKSSREVRVGVVNPDPLKFRIIACEELPR